MLNKKECENKLKNLKTLQDEINKNCTLNVVANIAFTNAIECFEDLIEEHFYNPPLKFEELKPDMFVWDNKRRTYIQIEKITESFMKNIFFNQIGWECCEHMEFEPNRLYRKEVQE